MGTLGITAPLLAGIFTSYRKDFQSGLASVAPWWSKVASAAPSNTAQNTYAWMAKTPRLRKWLGERQLQNLAATSYTLSNDDYELTVEVERNVIEDDQWGIYSPMFEMMGASAAKWPDDMVQPLLQSGESNKCYDGANFFDTAHPVSAAYGISGTQQNYWSTGKALTAANFDTVRQNGPAILGDDGKPMGITYDTLVVPPQLQFTGSSIVEMPTNAAGASNPYYKSADLLVIPELATDPTVWYLLCTKMPIKPFVFQQRKAPQMVNKFALTEENVFWQKKFVSGIDARGAAGYSLWQLAAKARA